MPGFDRRVCGKHGLNRGRTAGIIEREPVFFDAFANSLEDRERAVSFVQVENRWTDSQRSQGAKTADAKQDFLANPGQLVASVQCRRQLAERRGVAWKIGIEEQKPRSPDVRQPHTGT